MEEKNLELKAQNNEVLEDAKEDRDIDTDKSKIGEDSKERIIDSAEKAAEEGQLKEAEEAIKSNEERLEAVDKEEDLVADGTGNKETEVSNAEDEDKQGAKEEVKATEGKDKKSRDFKKILRNSALIFAIISGLGYAAGLYYFKEL